MSTRHLALGVAVTTLATSACLPGQKKESAGSPSASPSSTAPATQAAPASNGLAGRPAKEILTRVSQAVRTAKSMRMKGQVKDGKDLVAVDMWLTRAGARGTMRGPIEGKNVQMQIIIVGGRIYLRSPQLWQALGGAAMARRMGNRWIATSKAGSPGAGFVSLPAFSKEMLKPKGRVIKGKPATIAGRPVITLIDTGDRSVMYVSAVGKPYPVRVTEAGGKRPLNLIGHDTLVKITKPANVVRV